MAGIFKAYDIRGIVPDALNEEIAYKIGRAFVTHVGCSSVTIGHDMRVSSGPISQALIDGITEQGADVVFIGLASTPMLYFAAKDAEAGIIVTASHNPGEYNGFKLVGKKLTPIAQGSGIEEIEALVTEGVFQDPDTKGTVIKQDVMAEFTAHNLRFLADHKKKFKVVIDFGNGIGGFSYKDTFSQIDAVEYIPMYDEPDGSFPHHEANPLNTNTLVDLQKRVVAEGADFGVAVDGDADRCAFIDEHGAIISADMITALVAVELLKESPNATFLYDLRSSKIVAELIEENGGTAVMTRVGHSFIKQQMKKEDALFAGELSGHFYYKDSYFAESSIITVLKIMALLEQEGKSLSALIAPLKKYYSTGEINFRVEDKKAAMKAIESHFKDSAKDVFWLDGVSVLFDDWWCNVRASNTEPVLRLNLEADTQELRDQKKQEVINIIHSQDTGDDE